MDRSMYLEFEEYRSLLEHNRWEVSSMFEQQFHISFPNSFPMEYCKENAIDQWSSSTEDNCRLTVKSVPFHFSPNKSLNRWKQKEKWWSYDENFSLSNSSNHIATRMIRIVAYQCVEMIYATELGMEDLIEQFDINPGSLYASLDLRTIFIDVFFSNSEWEHRFICWPKSGHTTSLLSYLLI